ncbi:MAG: hypothetical protein ACJ77M_09515, partial [Thermoleophilaceae bacterium]
GLQQLMRNALDDLTRPAAPAALHARHSRHGVSLRAVLAGKDPRIAQVLIYRGSRLVCRTHGGVCRDPSGGRAARYSALAEDRWGRSRATFAKTVR